MEDLPDADEDVDPQTAALLGIASELTAIRQLLQQRVAMESRERAADEPAPDRFECRSCDDADATFATRDDAHKHARVEHGAPDMESAAYLITDLETDPDHE